MQKDNQDTNIISLNTDTEKGRQNLCMWHTFNQLWFAEDGSYLQPQMILKNVSGFLEVSQSVFVCFVLRLYY